MRRFSLAIAFLILVISGSASVLAVQTEGSQLVVEKEMNWNSTCIPGGGNVFVEDVDGDAVTEILTGGFGFMASGSNVSLLGQLKVWTWNGENLTLEGEKEWGEAGNTRVQSLYSNDVDGDGEFEIVTGGVHSNLTATYGELRVWRWDGMGMVLENVQVWCAEGEAMVNSVYASDVDNDGEAEIITGGRMREGSQYKAELRVWRWDGMGMVLENVQVWCAEGEAMVNSVYASDVDNDGEAEIITGGFDYGLENSSGQVCIWNGQTLALEESVVWQTTQGTALNVAGNVMGNTIVNSVRVGGTNSAGVADIISGGFTYDGEMVSGQVRVWRWNGDSLTLAASHEWHSENITEVKSVSVKDVTGDSALDIISSGFVGNATDGLAQLQVWSLAGNTVTLENEIIWRAGDGACAWNVDVKDADGDGQAEILTVGCMHEGLSCKGHLRIWSISGQTSFPPYGLYVGTAAGVIVISSAAVYLYVRNRRRFSTRGLHEARSIVRQQLVRLMKGAEIGHN